MTANLAPQNTGTDVQAGFTQIYAETSPPWDTGRPQPAFVAVSDRIAGPLLDSGCGTGGASVFFAARGLKVTGIDFVELAIERARTRAEQHGVEVEFLVKDAMTLASWKRTFSSIIDSGLYHIYPAENRRKYVTGLKSVLNVGGHLYLLSFSDDPRAPDGGITREEIEADFADGWAIEQLDRVPAELNPASAQSEVLADQKMWFAIIRRIA